MFCTLYCRLLGAPVFKDSKIVFRRKLQNRPNGELNKPSKLKKNVSICFRYY